MPRLSMKLTASVVGSLALLLATACERRTETTPEPGTTGTSRDPNSMNPTPSTSTPGTPTPGTTATPGTPSTPGSTSAVPSNGNNPSAAAPAAENPDTVPVRGTDSEMQGGGGAGGAGHGGQAGKGGKSGH